MFEDGSVQKQWANTRYWDTYRGTTRSPYSLQSAMMALEKWLLELAKQYPTVLDEFLLKLLKRSESVAITAVVTATVAAFPFLCIETVKVLLRSRECVQLERHRLASESQRPSL